MKRLSPILFVAALSVLPACKQNTAEPPRPVAVAKHEHKPPHHGTPVVLGDEEYHVELVLDSPNGKLQAFVMDGELENFVRIASGPFEILARPAGREETLVFSPVANNATGEKVGDTSLFEAQADWLKLTTNFDAVLKELEVRSKKYQNVPFNFPKGNDKDEKPAAMRRGTPIDSRSPANLASAPTELPATPVAATPMEMPATPVPAAPLPAFSTVRDAAPTERKDGYLDIGFDRLSNFPTRWYCQSISAGNAAWVPKLVTPIPDTIKALDGTNVAVRGFMLPLKLQEGLVTELVLSRNQMLCCFGKAPEMNELVLVRMEGKGVKAAMDQPVTICGTLRVGERRLDEGTVFVYLLDGRKLEISGPPQPRQIQKLGAYQIEGRKPEGS
jgi:hypothetical protein